MQFSSMILPAMGWKCAAGQHTAKQKTERSLMTRTNNMFKPRLTAPLTTYGDPDGIKLYTISAKGQPVDHHRYLERLAHIKRQKKIDSSTPAFAIFHDGASMDYLVVAWWMNENELFISV